MTTQWMKFTRFEPRQWLLANGDIVSEPELEQSGSGRKVRVAGTTKSVFLNDLDALLMGAAKAVAEAKGTKILSAVNPRLESSMLGELPPVAKLHLLNPTESGNTLAWWRFRDPNTPYTVTMFVKLTSGRGNISEVNVGLLQPVMNYDSGTPGSVVTYQSGYDQFHSHLLQGNGWDVNLDTIWREFYRNNPAHQAYENLVVERVHGVRPAVRKVLDAVRKIEDLDSIVVPNPSDPETPALLHLDLFETNVNGQFISDLTEYLDNSPTVNKITDLYQEMVKLMESLGMAVTAPAENDFLQALLSGDKGAMHLDVGYADNESFQKDNEHKVSLHMPSGTVIVECRRRHVDMNEIAEQWEEAQTIAKLTGSTAELALFGERAVREQTRRRTKRIIKERK